MNIVMSKALKAYQTCLVFKNEKIPLKLAYKFNRLISALEQEISFYNFKLNEILQECAELDENGKMVFLEDGQSVKIQEDKISRCKETIKELESLEVEIEDIVFNLQELESLEISIAEINGLMPFIKE